MILGCHIVLNDPIFAITNNNPPCACVQMNINNKVKYNFGQVNSSFNFFIDFKKLNYSTQPKNSTEFHDSKKLKILTFSLKSEFAYFVHWYSSNQIYPKQTLKVLKSYLIWIYDLLLKFIKKCCPEIKYNVYNKEQINNQISDYRHITGQECWIIR
jgi:hypothetical protein